MPLVVRCLVLLCLIPSALAQVSSGESELSFLPGFSNSQLELSEQREIPDYRLILGQLRIIGNQIRSDETRLSGELTRQTWRIPSGHSSQDAFNHYRTQLKQLGAEILFSCSSRDCGRSGEWATDVFRIPTLYGIDREQNYLAARVDQGGQRFYLAIYTIMRGNQRVYAHVDAIRTDASDNGGGAAEKGPRTLLPIRGNEFGVSMAEALAGFVQQARADSGKRIWIVVHTQGETWGQAAARGETFAGRLKLWLESQGIGEQRIQILAVGPLAPAHNQTIPAERAELFLMKE